MGVCGIAAVDYFVEYKSIFHDITGADTFEGYIRAFEAIRRLACSTVKTGGFGRVERIKFTKRVEIRLI